MAMPSREKILLQQVIAALQEDIGAGDITSLAIAPDTLIGRAEIRAKSDGIICGLPLCELTFLKVDPELDFQPMLEDGHPFQAGQRVAAVAGRIQSILTAERTALNFLMHLSGIATLTHKMVEAAGKDRVKILDTRKTTPGLRFIEKYAVATGGGDNHRYGLYDMVLIKDNHIAAVGSIAEAVRRLREFLSSDKYMQIFHTEPSACEVEVEVESAEELKEALDAGIERILLDNRSPEHLREMVFIARNHPNAAKVTLEASGNVTLNSVAEVAATGVDYISVGALTHSAPASDFSLKLVPNG